MNNIATPHRKIQNLDAASRIANAALGTILISIVFTTLPGGYLGWFSVLPIIAIYPCLTSILGYSPMCVILNALARQVDQYWSHWFKGQADLIELSAH